MARKNKFSYPLGANVEVSDFERGVIIGRAQYTNSNPIYLIRYMTGDGRKVEQWWSEDAIKPDD